MNDETDEENTKYYKYFDMKRLTNNLKFQVLQLIQAELDKIKVKYPVGVQEQEGSNFCDKDFSFEPGSCIKGQHEIQSVCLFTCPNCCKT